MLPTPIVRADYDKVYEPAEDSFLLLDCLEQEKEYLTKYYTHKIPLIVEIGTGSGIVTTFLTKNILPRSISIPTDLNPHACYTCSQTCKENGGLEFIDPIQADLTFPIRPKQIDILLFNPPYVPAEIVPEVPKTQDSSEWLDLALLGGEDGMVVTNRLLDQFDHILAPDGIAYILFCARNKPELVANVMEERGWNAEMVINRKAGWEVLSVYRFKRI